VHAVLSYGFESLNELVKWSGLMSSLPVDYLFKSSGAGHVSDSQLSRIPFPESGVEFVPLMLRVLRLNCLTAEYAPLWEELYQGLWTDDNWTCEGQIHTPLGEVEPTWSSATPLRRDEERWQALVEVDALAALLLGIDVDHLCTMYRTQFAVLRKYEFKMVFDSQGRKICGYHHSAGLQQSLLQEQAKDGDLPTEWKNLWNLYEQYVADPDPVDWLGHYTPPFTRVDREASMMRAYNEFERRLDAGEYGDP
jgi:hypothetical protein